MTRSPRAAARRRVAESLADIKRRVSKLQNWWTAESWIYVPAADRAPGENLHRRDRAPGEYPEAQRRYWASTSREIDQLIADLTVLRNHVEAEYYATPKEES